MRSFGEIWKYFVINISLALTFDVNKVSPLHHRNNEIERGNTILEMQQKKTSYIWKLKNHAPSLPFQLRNICSEAGFWGTVVAI